MLSIFQWTNTWAEDSKLSLWSEEQTTSTNSKAKENLAHDLYLTAHQTQGRGRSDHHWNDSGSGGEFLSTWKFTLSSPPQHITGPLLGLAVFQSVQSCWPYLPWSLKAPNDLFLGKKKIAGLLAETVSNGNEHHLLIGFGMNVFSAPKDIAQAGSLVECLEDELTSGRWHSFLSTLFKNFSKTTETCSEDHLQPTALKELLIALNANPNLQEKYSNLDENANLYIGDRKIPWQSL